MKKIFLVSFLVIIFDQITKILLKNKTYSLLNFFKINYIENIGASFGMLKGYNWLFILIALIVIFYIFKYLKKIKKEKNYVQIAIGLLLGGVIGNLIDRIFLGFVRDFIDLKIWPTFNIADACSTIAVILLAYHILTKK